MFLPTTRRTDLSRAFINKLTGKSISIDKYVRPYLASCVVSFVGGQLSNFLLQRETITCDQTIWQTATGEKNDFREDPPTRYVCPSNAIAHIHKEINSLLAKRVIIECVHEHGEFLSPDFSVLKKKNKVRLILNLTTLNTSNIHVLRWTQFTLF